MEQVTIYHPVLDREISVSAAAVQHYQLAGWQEGGRPAADQPESASDQPAGGPAGTETAPRRRRPTERSQ
ncbi:hypothetical protein MF672_010875 [Actinomadura sp. ATCC 31491]|uniref:Uncharacterized protein n=1 Tax=Actinomadura luzonensis TaxID=2805427 RepID=A0ABT0FQJ9_9ACTN|nr:hypothetical protein [Actinomadura luzonensis]MCK2214290.1 hypothetical protein [Actinomadura luzonensis]